MIFISANSSLLSIGRGVECMNTRNTKTSREPSYSPGFIKVAVIVLLVMIVLIAAAKLVVGVKLNIFGL